MRSMALAWTNPSTVAVHQHLASMRYGELMSASRECWREARPRDGGTRSTATLQQFAQFLHDTANRAKLDGHLAGIAFDDVDFVQIADHWLGSINGYGQADVPRRNVVSESHKWPVIATAVSPIESANHQYRALQWR